MDLNLGAPLQSTNQENIQSTPSTLGVTIDNCMIPNGFEMLEAGWIVDNNCDVYRFVGASWKNLWIQHEGWLIADGL
jgi:hypothetical protein